MLHHLAFRTAAPEALAAFYEQLFGFQRERTTDRGIWLALGDGSRLMIEPREEVEPAIGEGTLELVAFRIPREAVPGFRARLESLGIAIEASTDFTLYFRDLDGRRVGASHYP